MMQYALAHMGFGLLGAAPPAVTTDSMNDVFASSIHVLTTNVDATTSAGGTVLLGIATVEFILFLYGALMGGTTREIVRKGVEKGVFIFVVALAFYNWGAIANWTKGYIVGGASAAGGASSMVRTLNPAYVANEGFDKVAVIFNAKAQDKMMQGFIGDDPPAEESRAQRMRRAHEAANQSALSAVVTTVSGQSPTAMIEELSETGEQFALQLFALLLFGTLGVLIVLVYIYCAAMMFVITIEFYITVVMTKLLIPFALNKHTSGLATAAMNAVVAKAVQLGVLVLVLAMFGKAMEGLSLGPSPSLYEVLALLGTSVFMAFAISRVPAIAASIFAGAGSGMDIGGALVAGAAAAAGAAANLAAPIAGAGIEAAGKGMSATGKSIVDSAAAGAGALASAGGGAAVAAGQRAGGAVGKAAEALGSGLGGDASGFGRANKNLAAAEKKLEGLAGKSASPKAVTRAAEQVRQARGELDAVTSTPQGRVDAARANLKALSRSPSSTPGELMGALGELEAAEAALTGEGVREAGGAALLESDQTTGRVRGEVMGVSKAGDVSGGSLAPQDSTLYSTPGEQPQGYQAMGQGAGVLPAVTGPEALDKAETLNMDAVVTQEVPGVGGSVDANDWASPQGTGGPADDAEEGEGEGS